MTIKLPPLPGPFVVAGEFYPDTPDFYAADQLRTAQLKPINDEIWKRQVSQYPVYCVEDAIRALRTELENTK